MTDEQREGANPLAKYALGAFFAVGCVCGVGYGASSSSADALNKLTQKVELVAITIGEIKSDMRHQVKDVSRVEDEVKTLKERVRLLELQR